MCNMKNVLLILQILLCFDPLMAQQQNTFDINYLMGKFDPATHEDFIEIPSKYVDQSGRYLRKDVLKAFIKMYDAALKDGNKMTIKSSTRNFNYQKGIWEKKWDGITILEDGTKANKIKKPLDRALKILTYSSMPGTSRHHWGTDIDINSFTNSYFEKGDGKKLYNWMRTHAATYGFCQVYSKKDSNRPDGYNEEKWHWSYMPIASKLTDLIKSKMQNELISGFKGAEVAKEADMLQKYMLGINPACK
jgi:zinc D-Ala-D-Ala carboxypeptidase